MKRFDQSSTGTTQAIPVAKRRGPKQRSQRTKRSTLELTGLLALLYFTLLPFTASFSYTVELPGWLWLLGRFALFYVVLLRLRTYAPIWLTRIEDWLARLDQDH